MNKAEKEHLSKVAELGCVACYLQDTPGTLCEIHHVRAGKGKGQRASNYEVIGLCPAHHRGTQHPAVPSIHLAKRAFIDQFGTEHDLLELVRRLIGAEE